MYIRLNWTRVSRTQERVNFFYSTMVQQRDFQCDTSRLIKHPGNFHLTGSWYISSHPTSSSLVSDTYSQLLRLPGVFHLVLRLPGVFHRVQIRVYQALTKLQPIGGDTSPAIQLPGDFRPIWFCRRVVCSSLRPPGVPNGYCQVFCF